jgi:effector-binding domain-containing protein
MSTNLTKACLLLFFLSSIIACTGKNNIPAVDTISGINLKRGEIISCGPPDKEFGDVKFQTSCDKEVEKEVDLAMALLHSFEYDESEKAFAKIIDKEPGCAMAYWGVAMSNYHPLWAPPSKEDLEKGAKAIAVAQSISNKTKREEEYISSIAEFYKDWQTADHHTRSVNYSKAMAKLYGDYPDDKEAAIFYALSLTSIADKEDKTFRNQKMAGVILNGLYEKNPNHPGIVHYIIHAFDYPDLALLALPAARKYAQVAPSSAHALHMPSHIFIRLGLWDESINSNIGSVSSAQCYAQSAGIKGHWDEELHGLDYLMYGYLQKGDNVMAKKQLDYLGTINQVFPEDFKVAYAYAAIPARYVLENKSWKDAANLSLHHPGFSWKNFPWQLGIHHFARLMGDVNMGQLDAARKELNIIDSLHTVLVEKKNGYEANQVQIQINSAKAWILFKEGKKEEALRLMNTAAEMEDKTEKHSVTPGEVMPAREMLGDMLLQMNQPAKALAAYEADLKNRPGRFNALYGAARAAEGAKDMIKAKMYYKQLVASTATGKSDRPELREAKAKI